MFCLLIHFLFIYIVRVRIIINYDARAMLRVTDPDSRDSIC